MRQFLAFIFIGLCSHPTYAEPPHDTDSISGEVRVEPGSKDAVFFVHRSENFDLSLAIEQADQALNSADYETAFSLSLAACDAGEVDRCMMAAQIATQSMKHPVSERVIQKLYRMACDGGHEEACRRVAASSVAARTSP